MPAALALLMVPFEFDWDAPLVVEVLDPGATEFAEFGIVDEFDEGELGWVAELGVFGDVDVVGAELDGFELDGPVCVPGAVGDRGAAGAPGAVGALVDDDVEGAALDCDAEDDDGAEVPGADADEDAEPPDAPPEAPAATPPPPPPD